MGFYFNPPHALHLDFFHSSYQSVNSHNVVPLASNHFLFGEGGDQFPSGVEERICYGGISY